MNTLDERISETAKHAIDVLNNMEMPSRPAVIFDIDETLMARNGTVIQPMLKLYNHVKMLCITPIIITNRPGEENVMAITKYELDLHGITGYYDVYFRDPEDMDFTRAKLRVRKNLSRKGFDIIMSVGDRDWDIGQYGGVGILVPS